LAQELCTLIRRDVALKPWIVQNPVTCSPRLKPWASQATSVAPHCVSA
jgi:hypothetical protein